MSPDRTSAEPRAGIAAEPGATARVIATGGGTLVVLVDGERADAIADALAGAADAAGAPALLAAWRRAVDAAGGARASVLAAWLGDGAVALWAGDAALHGVDARGAARRLVEPHTTLAAPARHPLRVRSRALGLAGAAGEPELRPLALDGVTRIVASTLPVWLALEERFAASGAPADAASSLCAAARDARLAAPLASVLAAVPRACVVADVPAGTARPADRAPHVAVAAQRRAGAALRRAVAGLVSPHGAVLVGERGAGKSAALARLGADAEAVAPRELARALRAGAATVAGGAIAVVDPLAEAVAEPAAAAALAAALARGALRLVGAATPRELDAIARACPALADELAAVPLEPPTEDELAAILAAWAPRFERRHRVRIDPAALPAAAALSARFPGGRAQPEAALFVLEQACVRAGGASLVTGAPGLRGGGVVGVGAVRAAVADHARIALELITTDEHERTHRLEHALGARLAGQAPAIAAVTAALSARLARREVDDRARRQPALSLLLVGPTGTGKTELARLLAEAWFLDREALTAIDLTEYADATSVARLVGAAPGYVGHGDRPALAAALAGRPAQVVLFDELEKAHPAVHDLLLQLLDEGRLTTARGEVIAFDRAIVVMTSNLRGAHGRAGYAPDAPADDDRRERDGLAGELRPELVARIDAVVRFAAIRADAARAIAMAHVRRVGEALAAGGRLPPARLPAVRAAVLAALAGRDRFPGGARDVLRLVDDALDRERVVAPPRDDTAVIYPWHGAGREVAASGVRADLAADADPAAAIDLILTHPAGTSLLYVARAGARVLALLGDPAAARAVADALAPIARVAVADGRVAGDLAGRPRGPLVDALLAPVTPPGA